MGRKLALSALIALAIYGLGSFIDRATQHSTEPYMTIVPINFDTYGYRYSVITKDFTGVIITDKPIRNNKNIKVSWQN